MTRCAPRTTGELRSPVAPSPRPWATRRFVLASGFAASILAAAPLMAQPAPGHRVFPATALRGELIVSTPPDVVLNGRTDRLAPGARLRGEDNLLVMTGAVSGQRLVVHYTRESTTGLLLDVWILNAVERQNRVWPTTPAEAQAWRFDPAAQSWTRP